MIDFILNLPREAWDFWGPVWTGIWIVTAAVGSYALLRQDQLRAKYGAKKEAWILMPLVQLIGITFVGGGAVFLKQAASNAALLDDRGQPHYFVAAFCLLLGVLVFPSGLACIFFGVRTQFRLALLHLRSHVPEGELSLFDTAFMRSRQFALLRRPDAPRIGTLQARAALVAGLIFSSMASVYLSQIYFA